MGIPNGKNYALYLIGLVVAAAVGFGVNYFMSVGVSSPKQLENLQGQINVLSERITGMEVRQADFNRTLDSDIAEFKGAQTKTFEKLEEVQRDLRIHLAKAH